MRTLRWTCLWPGLAALWVRGRWGGLMTATAFAGLVNFALLASLAGDRLPIGVFSGGGSRWLVAAGAWTLVLGLWVLGVRLGQRELSAPQKAPATENDTWFREAQTHYLKAHWLEAETLLARLLARQPDDVEARLLWAAILRRTGRTAEARRVLTELRSDPAASGWRWEIDGELARMSAARSTDETARKAA